MPELIRASRNQICAFAQKLSRAYPVEITTSASNINGYPAVTYNLDTILKIPTKTYHIDHRENCVADHEDYRSNPANLEQDELQDYAIHFSNKAVLKSNTLLLDQTKNPLESWQVPLTNEQATNIANFFNTQLIPRKFYTLDSLTLAINQPPNAILAAAHAFHKPTLSAKESYEYPNAMHLQNPQTVEQDWQKRLYQMFSIPKADQNPDSPNYVSPMQLEKQLQN